MPDKHEVALTREGLGALTEEVRSADGPGATTKAFNTALIAAFRANNGSVPGEFQRASLLLLTTTGAKSGAKRTTPLAYVRVEDRIIIIASMGGAPTSPRWFANLVAHPEVTVELGGETFAARAVVTAGEERDRLFRAVVAQLPVFADYQQRTTRQIPVVALARVP